MYGYLWGKAAALQCLPHAIGGMPDHIHIAIPIPPKLSIATVVGQLKGASSHHVNDLHAEGSFAWQAEYGVLSFSEKSLSAIVAYINNQEKHHAANDLQLTMEMMDL
jgi:putative transposase